MPTKPSRNSEPLSRGMTTLDKNSTFQIVEAYKAVRTNLLFALAPSKLKSVIVTGAEPGSGKSGAVWKKLSGEEEFVDLFRRTGQKNRGVNYVRTTIHCETERHVTLGVTLDYFGKVWLNGKLLKVFDSMHGGVREPVMIPVVLKKGENELLLKVHAGSAGNEFSASLNTLK